jgi:hypothetical protein
MVYDSKRGMLILFGGLINAETSVGDIWEHSEVL